MTDLNNMSLDEMENALLEQNPDDLYSDGSGGKEPPKKESEDGDGDDKGKEDLDGKKEDGSDDSDEESEDGDGDDKGKEDQDQEDQKKEPPKNIKKLLEQRNDARKERDIWKEKVKEKDDYIKKLENGELDDEFKDEDGEIDEVKKDRALIKAENQKAIIEHELEKSDGSLVAKREQELNQFIDKNPDYAEFKEDIKKYADNHQNLDIDDIAMLILAKSDPTRLLDEQTKNKIKGGYGLGGSDKTINNKPKTYDKMSDQELESELENQFKSGGI